MTEDSDDEGDDESDSIDIDPFEAVLERVQVKHISRFTIDNGNETIPPAIPRRC
jgi:hypothetical protein